MLFGLWLAKVADFSYGYLENLGFWFKIEARMEILPEAYS